VGKCYYKLGLLRDAEKQFASSLKAQEMVSTYLWICKIYQRLDQPNTSLDYYLKSIEKFPSELSLVIGIARLYDALNEMHKSVQYYKKVLVLDSSNIEAIACLASNQFYSDQPELALRYYRRLLQVVLIRWTLMTICRWE
jgi:tetratricopeptide repeat protein 8